MTRSPIASRRQFAWTAFAAALVLALWTQTTAHERISTTITWDREVSAIVRARCLECHVDGGRAPMPLTTYAEARPWARAIKHEVLTRRMPIWHAARGFGDFANDPSLSPFEIALIAAWVDGGAPKNLPSSMPVSGSAIESSSGMEVPAMDGREVSVPCGQQAAPRGRLIGLRPKLTKGASVRVQLRLPGGRTEILGWFREFDPEFAPTYWLRTPVEIPAGAHVTSEGTTGCAVTLTLANSTR